MERMWTYFLQLGTHMWRDEYSQKTNRPTQCEGDGYYCPTLETDKDVWRRVTEKLPSFGINTLVIDMGEGLQYESHPELAIPGSWTRDELRAELARLRGMGIEPIPKLNFSTCHDDWLGPYNRMVSSPKYYEVVADLIGEVCEVFDHPRLFHLGMDEEDFPDHHGAITTIRCDELWWHDLYYMFDQVEKGGARPWVWSDYYWNHPDSFVRKMPKECVQSNWRYEKIQPKGKDGRYPQIGYQTYLDFHKLGYDQIPCASDWCFRQNIAQTVWLFIEENLCDEHLLGFIAVPWLFTTDVNYYSLLDNAHRLHHARRMFLEKYPEG